MANFDKLLSQSTYKCEIMKPFKMSDYGIYDDDDPRLWSLLKIIINNTKLGLKI